MPVEVILDVFSGRPNPRWMLSDEQAAELVRRLAALSPSPQGKAPAPPDLGYRGFEVETHGVSGLSGPVRVYRGFVRLAAGLRLDPRRATERWLLESAGAVVEPPVLELVLHEIEGRV